MHESLAPAEELSYNVTEHGCEVDGHEDTEIVAVVTGWERGAPTSTLTVTRAYRLSRTSRRIERLPDPTRVSCTAFAGDRP